MLEKIIDFSVKNKLIVILFTLSIAAFGLYAVLHIPVGAAVSYTHLDVYKRQYLNTPKAGVRERSEIHYGSTILNFDGFKVTKMDGEYWTDRETTGEITLTKKNVA